MSDRIMRALVYSGNSRLKKAWFMFTAARAHSVGYGLTFGEWFPYAWALFCSYLRYPDGKRPAPSTAGPDDGQSGG
jgi:hypothetical protein